MVHPQWSYFNRSRAVDYLGGGGIFIYILTSMSEKV